MRIKSVEIKNYKVFYQEYKLELDGKNLFIYGENGSGKSSFYYALKDFFQSSVEEIPFAQTENIFLTKKQKGKGFIRVIFNPDKDGNATDKAYTLANDSKNTYVTGDTSIRDAIKLKSFLTHKHLLGIHNVAKVDEIDLFPLLIGGVLKHFKSAAITGNKELGELWEDVRDSVSRATDSHYNITRKKKDVDRALERFNKSFKPLFEKDGVENILKYAQPILDKFGHNIDVDLRYVAARPNSNYEVINRGQIKVSIKYNRRPVDKPHLFLNEARLSALAISLYLGTVKRHVQGIPCKILFLDDIFIGLDIGNRLPLLEILDSEFQDYQLIITTYDKPWYEFVRLAYLEGNKSWKGYEFYARRARKGFELPVVLEQGSSSNIQNYIDKAERYFNAGDNKAAGVYVRSAFEFILKRFCVKKRVPVPFLLDGYKVRTDEFWRAVKIYKIAHPGCKLTQNTETQIDHYTSLVLNPLSHHDVNKHEISAELKGAIQTIRNLKAELEQ